MTERPSLTTAELDSMFMPAGHRVHPLEQAARLCLVEARDSRNIGHALLANRCAIAIRSMPEWRVYEPVSVTA